MGIAETENTPVGVTAISDTPVWCANFEI